MAKAIDPLNEILYSKNLYGQSAGNKAKQSWAADNANKYYSQLDPAEAAKVRSMGADQLKAHIAGLGGGKTGATPGASATPGSAGATPSAGGVNATPGFKFTNDYLEQASKLMTQLGSIMSTDFKFDYKTDPSYLAAVQSAQEGAKDATRNTLETMNDRGILNSSITSSQLGQIEQKAELAPLQLVPGLEANAYNRFQQGIGNQFNMLNTLLNQGQWQADQPYKEAAVTGRYMPDGAQSLIDTVLNAKQSYAGASKEDRVKLAQSASDARRQLSALGIDAEKLFGANVGLDSAYSNAGHAGMLTVGAQSDLLNSIMGLTNTYGSLPKGAGGLLGNTPLFGGLGGIMKGLEGKPTLDMKRYDLSKESSGNQDAIQWANYNLSKLKNDQDQDKTLLDANSFKATQGYMTQLLGGAIKTREDAMSYIVEHAPDIVADNADIGKLFDAVDQKYPKPANEKDPAATPSLSPSQVIDLNNKALSAAKADSRWPGTAATKGKDKKTPAQIKSIQDALVEEWKAKLLQGALPGN